MWIENSPIDVMDPRFVVLPRKWLKVYNIYVLISIDTHISIVYHYLCNAYCIATQVYRWYNIPTTHDPTLLHA